MWKAWLFLIAMIILPSSVWSYDQTPEEVKATKAMIDSYLKPIDPMGKPRSSSVEDMAKYLLSHDHNYILSYVNDVCPKNYNGPRFIKNSSGKWVDFGYNPMCGLDIPPAPYKTVDEYLTALADKASSPVSKKETGQSISPKVRPIDIQTNTGINTISPINLTELILAIQQFILK